MSVANENVANRVLKDYSREPVPEDKTHTWLSMGLIWSGVGISLGLLLTGGAIGNGMSATGAIAAAVIGGFVLTVVTCLTGIIGARTRLSTAMISRFAFGRKAIVLIAFIQALGSYGWFAVQLGLFGDTAATAWGTLTGTQISAAVFIVVGGILMMSTAIAGYRGVDLLSKLSVPLMLILITASVWMVLRENSLGEVFASQGAGEPISLAFGISLTVSSFIVGAVVAPDVARYAKSPGHTIGGAFMAFGVVTPLVLISGSLMAIHTGTSDIVEIMIRLGWGVLALVLLMLAQWSSNDNNLYSAALGLAVIFTRLPKWQLTAIAGVIGIVLALMGIYDNFISFLSVLGILIPPMAGVLAADFYVSRTARYELTQEVRIPALRIPSLAAWAIGSLVSLVMTYTDLSLTAMPPIDGLLVGGLAHLVLSRVLPGSRDAAAAEPERSSRPV